VSDGAARDMTPDEMRAEIFCAHEKLKVLTEEVGAMREFLGRAQAMIRPMHRQLLGADCGCIWCDASPPFFVPALREEGPSSGWVAGQGPKSDSLPTSPKGRRTT